MAREVITADWCDPCMNMGIRTPADTTVPVQIGRAKARELMFCKEHEASVLQPFRDLYDGAQVLDVAPSSVRTSPQKAAPAAGQTVIDLTEKQGPLPCPLCTNGYRAPNPTAYNAHVAASHKLGKLSDKIGNVCPICAREFENGRGLAQHQTNHGYRSVLDLFVAAIEQGDPHGVAVPVLDTLRADARASALS